MLSKNKVTKSLQILTLVWVLAGFGYWGYLYPFVIEEIPTEEMVYFTRFFMSVLAVVAVFFVLAVVTLFRVQDEAFDQFQQEETP